MTTAVQVELTRGQVALISRRDVSLIRRYSWSARRDSKTGRFQAIAGVYLGGGRKHARVKTFLMHRVILGVDDPKVFVDHKNGDTLDNRRCNLRRCTNQQNQFNRGLSTNATSGYKGVWRHKGTGRWQANICHNRKKHYLGLHNTAEEAAKAYNVTAKRLYGKFARLNCTPAGKVIQ